MQARHRLKPLDKLIGATEKLAMGENAPNPYVVISTGEFNSWPSRTPCMRMVVPP